MYLNNTKCSILYEYYIDISKSLNNITPKERVTQVSSQAVTNLILTIKKIIL